MQGSSQQRLTLAVTLAVAAVVLGAQVPIALGLLDPDFLWEAHNARGVLAVNAALAVLTVAAAALLPARLRGLALLPGGAVASAMLGASVTAGGHLWDVAMPVLTLLGAWWAGRALLRALGVAPLRVFVVELVVGFGVVGLVVLVAGRLHVIEWWNVGLLAIAAGVAGLWTGGRTAWTRRAAVWEAVAGTRIGVACAGLLMLQLGWAIVWLSAPEIMFDALSTKAYLPHLWAETGAIESLVRYPTMNVTGLAQFLAVPGHAVGADDVGRVLQTLSWIVLASTIWWWAGAGSAAGPLAALAAATAPQVVWQTTTAYDDLLMAVGAVALAVAAMRTIPRRGAASAAADAGARPARADAGPVADGGDTTAPTPPLRTGLAIGLLAGTCIWLKLSLLVLVLVVAGGWVLLGGARRDLLLRAAGAAAGAAAVAAPSFVLRWIDTGNPVFPSYNHIFKSSHYPPVNEQFNFPFWPDATFVDLLRLPYEAIADPTLMGDTNPPGAYGLLVAAVIVAVLLGWRARERRAALVIWLAVVVNLLAWWVQFRYLRYLLPTTMVAVLLVVTQLRGLRPRRGATVGLLAAAAAVSALYLPATVASFWNVPGHRLPFAAAFGRWDAEDYLGHVFPELGALEAYRANAEPGEAAIAQLHQRLLLDGQGISNTADINRMLELRGPVPTDPDALLARFRELGFGWAIVTGPSRVGQGQDWLTTLLRTRAEIVYGDRGWDLYRLVDRPRRPDAAAHSCDPSLRGGPGCWTGTLDETPGLTAAENPMGVNRPVPVCPGQIVGMRVRTAPGGEPAQVALNAAPPAGLSGQQSAQIPPGQTEWLYLTVPDGTSAVTVFVTPGAGGAVEDVRVGMLGDCAG